ncbi:non-ribosomal peptide synthetase [Streptomyces sp. LaPpAH-108]|uniref:non-ribosomal peptide synthetase n=1 Tax=Streptomyces sp. LaPpAH-108 TaxID=1155714 RepID=UPI00036F91F4|nr:non-ribosomal peptide synthetase [Streptomyces sp. LaPpAH-108]
MTEKPVRRQELIDLLLRGRDSRQRTVAQFAARARLSRDQQRLWFLEQQYPGTAQNNIAVRLDLSDAPERAELERALARLQEVHQALRLRVSGSLASPMQEVTASCKVPLEWHDLSGLASATAQARAEQLTISAAHRPLDLGRPPLYRATAVLLPNGNWQLVLVFHHLITDGWSVGVLYEDLAQLLSGKEIEQPATTFVDWVARDNDKATPDWVSDYWKERLADAPVPVTLAVREGSNDPHLRGGLIPFSIDADLTGALRLLARELGVTLYAVCLAAFKVVLRRFANSPEVVVGSPAAGREDPALDRVVGFFVRTLALRTDIALDDNFADVARRVQQTVTEALDHQPMPFDELVALTGASGGESTHPLFRTMLAYLGVTGEEPEWNGRLHAVKDLDTGTAKFDLTIALNEHATSISGAVEWAERGADEIAAKGALDAFLATLRMVVRQPEARVGEIPLSEPPLPEHSGHTATGCINLADGLFRQANRTPQAIALIDEYGGTENYASLADRVARAAERLRQVGLRPGDRVALLLERSTDLVVAVHAVTAVGCGYVPIDTTAPSARVAELLTSAGVQAIVVHEATRALLPNGPWHVLDAADDTLALADRRTSPVAPGGYSHLLYTSGSTGTPKLVAFPADAQQAFLDWLQSSMPLSADDRVLLKTPYGFDVSLWELFWPLQHGAALVVARPSAHSDPAHLAELIRRQRVTVANFVPSILEHFLDEPAAAHCTSLRYLLSAGEQLTNALRDQVHRRLSATLVNLYGPTETNAVTAYTCAPHDGGGPVPIGMALPHTRLHVLDAELRPVPVGLPGELYIGGELGTAIGYWGQPVLTAERFVPDPFSAEPGRRLYRTGDGARQLPDGGFEYLGRLDRQVKLHGVRIEPAEIEAALTAHPSVASARVLVLGEGSATELVAFCTPCQGTTVDPNKLRSWAVTRLQRQFVPRTLLELPQLPLNINGKTDTKALTEVWQAHHAERRNGTVGTGSDAVEREVHAAFEEVLGHDVSDREATFFELGGNSMLLLRLAVVMEGRTGFRPGIADLTRFPTVALLADLLRSRMAPSDPLIPLAGVPNAPKLILLPPASGSALPYVPLSQELAPTFSVLGFNAPGFGGIPPQTVPDFVAKLLPAVEQAAAEGPVVLAGWSFGGVLAYELGMALSMHGVEPAAVVMFDSWVPTPSSEPAEDDTDGIATLREHGLIPDGLGAADIHALAAMVTATTEAFRTYQPSGRASFPVHLIRAGHGYPGMADSGYDDCRGWADIIPQLQISEVAADHFGVLHPAVIHELAKQVRAVATRALLDNYSKTEGNTL